MDILIPIEISGRSIDVSSAPILMIINVGGYMSVKNVYGGDNGVPLSNIDVGMYIDPSTGFARKLIGGGVVKAALGLVYGYVVVIPGVRGIDCMFPGGIFYGRAPAPIVDLKAVVRYIRYNADVFPGNENWIIATGCSAGGALAALLAASADNPFYEPYLEAIGAAKASDRIFAAAPFCPMLADHFEYIDSIYEWQFGEKQLPTGQLVDPKCSKPLASRFEEYLSIVELRDKEGRLITLDIYPRYVTENYLIPAATKYIKRLPESLREEYLKQNKWIRWCNDTAYFTWEDYNKYHVDRLWVCPAFDGPFDPNILQTLKITTEDELQKLILNWSFLNLGITPTNMLFGTETDFARHFTDFGLRYSTRNPSIKIVEVYPDIPEKIKMMDPMHFILGNWPNIANYWRIRTGSKDIFASIFMWTNLAIALENLGKSVDFEVYWEGGHGVDYDPWNLMEWINRITGYKVGI